MNTAPTARRAWIALTASLAACSGDTVDDVNVTSAAEVPVNTQLLSETSLAADPAPEVDVARLGNGPRVLFLPRHSVPMVSCTVLVPAGSSRETPATNGAAHYLEHLLFNGTRTRTREEIYAEADLLGAYNNASTQRERTVFQLLLPSENWIRGLELQADMLLHSTLPPDKFEKEKGIILEELAKDRASPEYAADRFEQRALWGDDARALPVLGTVESITDMDPAAVSSFYKEGYRPEGLTIILMGAFDRDEAQSVLQRLYGDARAEAAARPAPGAGRTEPGTLPARPPFPGTPELHAREFADLGRVRATLHFPAPAIGSPEFAATQLLAAILSDGEQSAVSRAAGAATETVLSAGAGLNGGEPWSGFHVSVELPAEAEARPVVAAVMDHLVTLLDGRAISQDLPAARRSRFVEEIGLHEKMHYYGLMRADLLGSGNPALAETVLLKTRELRTADVVSALAAVLHAGQCVATLTGPGVGNGTEPLALPAVPARAEIRIAADTHDAPIPDPEETIPDRQTRRLLFRNGFTLIQHGSPDARTFAAHLLVRGRRALERETGVPHGTSDVVHRMLELGTADRTEDELRGELHDLGASLKVTDTAWIPYDDYYFSPEFSYVRLETIDSFGVPALELLAEIVRTPRLTEEALEKAREAAAARAERDAGSARRTAVDAFLGALGEGHPEAGGVLGSPDTVRAVTLEDVRRYHTAMTAPENLVLCVSSSLPLAVVDRAVRRLFPDGARPAPRDAGTGFRPAAITSERRLVAETGAEQAWVVLGESVSVPEEDRAAVRLAVAILSERLAEELREGDGLAYSIGAGARLDGEGTYIRLSAGTRPENVDAMEAGMRRILGEMVTRSPSRRELDGARNRAEGRARMRRLTRMGIAYAMSMAELRGHSPLDIEEATFAAGAVTTIGVRHAAQEYLTFDAPVLSVAR